MKNNLLILKTIFDFTLASILLVILSPLLLVISLLILMTDGHPIFFIQDRPGLNEKIFKLIKFRTMKVDVQSENLSDFARMTFLGDKLRKYSLDELPQLINILKGDLSFVGPRPLLTEYLPLYNQDQKQRHLVKPGITGWAQVNGRNTITWEQKFEYDLWYVKNWSLLLDFKIIIMTINKIFDTSGVNSSNKTTMEKFKGSP